MLAPQSIWKWLPQVAITNFFLNKRQLLNGGIITVINIIVKVDEKKESRQAMGAGTERCIRDRPHLNMQNIR